MKLAFLCCANKREVYYEAMPTGTSVYRNLSKGGYGRIVFYYGFDNHRSYATYFYVLKNKSGSQRILMWCKIIDNIFY